MFLEPTKWQSKDIKKLTTLPKPTMMGNFNLLDSKTSLA